VKSETGRHRWWRPVAFPSFTEKLLYDLPQTVCISHGDCLEDAQLLEREVKEITPDMPAVICQHEPFSGTHVGPGMLALFFRGKER